MRPCNRIRAVMRCPHCGMNQFVTSTGNCRRCSKPLQVDAGPGKVQAAPEPVPTESPSLLAVAGSVADRVKQVRVLRGLTQRSLGRRMGVPRTYVSKIENGRCTPSLPSLQRLAVALTVDLGTLVGGGDLAVDQLRDPFLSELRSYLSRLSEADRKAILDAARRMAQSSRERAA